MSKKKKSQAFVGDITGVPLASRKKAKKEHKELQELLKRSRKLRQKLKKEGLLDFKSE